MNITDFLLERIAETEEWGQCFPEDSPAGRYVLADCEAKRRIVDQHKAWPVLVETPTTFEAVYPSDPHSMTFRAYQQIAWMTEQEYRTRFGIEPPTAPMIRTLALPYADHPDYREEWRS